MRAAAFGLVFLAAMSISAAPLAGQSRPSPDAPVLEVRRRFLDQGASAEVRGAALVAMGEAGLKDAAILRAALAAAAADDPVLAPLVRRALPQAPVALLADALEDRDHLVRRESARALRLRGREAAPALPALSQALSACDGKTAAALVVSYLDALRAMGAAARPAAEAVARLLPPEAPLHAERDKSDVTRLRSYLFATLADVGVPKIAVPHVIDSLVNTDERVSALEATAAARAAGALETGGRPVADYLVRALETGYLDDSVSLERYETPFPAEEATTFSREALRALERLRPVGNGEVRRLLERLAAGEHPLIRRDPTLATRARRALDAIDAASGPASR